MLAEWKRASKQASEKEKILKSNNKIECIYGCTDISRRCTVAHSFIDLLDVLDSASATIVHFIRLHFDLHISILKLNIILYTTLHAHEHKSILYCYDANTNQTIPNCMICMLAHAGLCLFKIGHSLSLPLPLSLSELDVHLWLHIC